MKLRTRMAITAAAVVLPVVVGVLWIDARDRHQAARRGLDHAALTYMLQGERASCEASPASWGGRPMPPPDRMHTRLDGERPERPAPPGPPPVEHLTGAGLAPPVLWAYDARLRSANPAAPALQRAPEDPLWPGRTISTLVAMPWGSGPCAYILATGSSNPGWVGATLPRSRVWLVPAAAALMVLLISAGPVVRRIRRLTRAVQDTAAVNFTEPVPVEGNDEVAALARAFSDATLEVRRLLTLKEQRERALRDYLAGTTHDVMIPLTVLQSHLTTIHEQRIAGQQVDLSAIVDAMTEAHYLGALAHNLAAAARLDAGAPAAREPVDLGAVAQRVLARHRPVARQRQVALEGAVPDEPVVVEGDVTLLEQAVNNIVYNSIVYNRAGGNVGVTVDRVSGAGFRLRVVDDGPGLADEELSRLVERGYRGDQARTRAPEGQGLGLSIAFRVAQAHGFELRFVRSEYGGLQVDLVGGESGDELRPRPGA